MPSKTSKKKPAAALPSIPKELIDQMVIGPMDAEAVNAASMAFKKALIERILGAELSHHLGYPPGADKPGEIGNHRNGATGKTVLTEDGPLRIVPALADEGLYIASESSFQRVLRAHGQTRHRGRTRAPQPSRAPTTHVATAPCQVWCWDMTYLPTQVQGQWFYLYLIMDLYSRKIVGREIHERDDADHAVSLLKRTALAEGIHAMTDKPVLHGDNGSTLKATTVLAMLHWLGVKPSYSRPRVSDDNAYVESLFKTAKYRPEFPARGFDNLEEARAWGHDFVRWYSFEHRHSAIRYVTPAQRHALEDRAILAANRCGHAQSGARCGHLRPRPC